MTRSSSNDRKPISERDLQGYLDGELCIERRAEVEAYLAAHPEQAARIADYSNLTLDLHRLFDSIETPVNTEIEALTEDLERAFGRRRMVRRFASVAAVVAILVTATVLATGVHDRFRQAEDRFLAFTQQATDAHMLFAGNVQTVEESDFDSTTTVVSWLSQRLTGVPVRAPDLSAIGYDLMVERILPSEDGPAAQLMYENETKSHPVTLFIGKSRDKRQNAFTFVQNEELSIFYWQEGPFAYSLAGKLERDDLLMIAEEVNTQLTALPPMPKSMVQRRPGESTHASDGLSAATGKPVGTVPAAIPESDAAREDGLVHPVIKKLDATGGTGVATERSVPGAAETGTEAPKATDSEVPSVAPVPESETDA
ncbi:MAG: anti-sigma factor, partial [Pseudomonadota bacterium]